MLAVIPFGSRSGYLPVFAVALSVVGIAPLAYGQDATTLASVTAMDQQANGLWSSVVDLQRSGAQPAAYADSLAEARRLWTEAARLAEEFGADSVQAGLVLKVALTHQFEGNAEPAHEHYARARRLGTSGGNPYVAATALENRAFLLSASDRMQDAIALRDTALTLLADDQLPGVRFSLLMEQGADRRKLQEFEAALADYEAAVALSNREDVDLGLGETGNAVAGSGFIYFDMELFEEARTRFDAAMTLYDQADSTFAGQRARVWWARTAALSGHASQLIGTAMTSDHCPTSYSAVENVEETLATLEEWNAADLDSMLERMEAIVASSVGEERARELVARREEMVRGVIPTMYAQVEQLRSLLDQSCDS